MTEYPKELAREIKHFDFDNGHLTAGLLIVQKDEKTRQFIEITIKYQEFTKNG